MSILLNKDTTFIVQGITGREAVNLTRECLDYGSKIVGGVTLATLFIPTVTLVVPWLVFRP